MFHGSERHLILSDQEQISQSISSALFVLFAFQRTFGFIIEGEDERLKDSLRRDDKIITFKKPMYFSSKKN